MYFCRSADNNLTSSSSGTYNKCVNVEDIEVCMKIRLSVDTRWCTNKVPIDCFVNFSTYSLCTIRMHILHLQTLCNVLALPFSVACGSGVNNDPAASILSRWRPLNKL